MEPATFIDPIEAQDRLSALDIDPQDLLAAVSFGQAFWADATLHDPRSSVGITAWGKTVRMLRDILVPKGWTVENHHNYELTVHPSGDFAIAVSAGDDRTALSDDLLPETRAPKGVWTTRVVNANKLQLSFAEVSPEWVQQIRQTWMLLYYRDNKTDELRVELSLPVGMNEDGRVDEWQERIVLTNSDELNIGGEDTGYIDVPVEMKA